MPESSVRSVRPELPVGPNSPRGLCGRNATLKMNSNAHTSRAPGELESRE